ncbi:hypothetical protein BH20ACT24_BH20ACT24_00030 [soil metagenome]
MAQSEQQRQSQPPSEGSGAGTGQPPPTSPMAAGLSRRGRSELITERGKTSIADAVVAKIAGIAAQEISGVHNMGAGAARALGALKERLPIGSSGPSASQGVSVEVGERQAAIDVDLVAEYGVSIPDLAQAVRDNVSQSVERMTGLEVTEVNVNVDDVWLGEEQAEESRVE